MITTQSAPRNWIPENLDLGNWQQIEPYFILLADWSLNSKDDLLQWLGNYNELEVALTEKGRRTFITFSTHADDESAKQKYIDFVTQIAPKEAEWSNKLKVKLVNCPYTNELFPLGFGPALRKMKKDIQMFRQENIPLKQQETLLCQQYDSFKVSQKITFDSKEISMDDARELLRNHDRNYRRELLEKVASKAETDADELDRILTELVKLRNEIAINAGYKNYVQYRYDEWGRFDYTPQQAATFDDTVARTVAPFLLELDRERQAYLQLDVLRPYDLMMELTDRPPLKPSANSADLVNKTIACLGKLDHQFSGFLTKMRDNGHLDIEPSPSKMKGVAYNAELPESGMPYIMQNNKDTAQDVTNLIHEAGHAMHTFLKFPLKYSLLYEDSPMEVNELASKSMEWMSMDGWNIFYPDRKDLLAARQLKLREFFRYLVLFSMGESFQRWLYENPDHTIEERREKWGELSTEYSSGLVDFSGFEQYRSVGYQYLMPVYDLPFYMVAYSFSDLGSVALWKNYRSDPKTTIDQYKRALSLGNTVELPELYRTAGINFNFTEPYIREMLGFVMHQLNENKAPLQPV